MAADVNFNLVIRLRKNLMEKLDLEKLSAGASRMRAIEGMPCVCESCVCACVLTGDAAAVFDELCHLLDPGVVPFKVLWLCSVRVCARDIADV